MTQDQETWLGNESEVLRKKFNKGIGPRAKSQGLVLFWPQNSDMEGKQGTGSVTRFVKELNNSGKALYLLS